MTSKNVDPMLNKMLGDMNMMSPIYRPSDFWVELNATHLEHLTHSGYANFKRSISGKYFSWGISGILAHQLLPILLRLFTGGISTFRDVRFKKYSTNLGPKVRRFNLITGLFYKFYVSMLLNYVKSIDKDRLLEKIEEPEVGNPFIFKYHNKYFSQDLCNSIHEFYSIANKIDSEKINNVAELGAGYGRLAYIFLKTLPKIKYCVVDIPPALYISQRYLTDVFPKEKIFKYRKFSSFKNVKTDFEKARIRFLMPDQLELLPKNYFDLIISISTLHEMTRPQIKKYIDHIDRVGKGYFYTKQWRRARTHVNSNIQKKEYPIPKKWKIIFEQDRHPIQRWFFDKLYLINK